jgi:7-carboxy-7-deazaguanine synthase (Cx14CxxC type)
VKEIFRTLQGEGQNTGRVAVFVRFAGCNLWSGREADRPDAQCKFCDTDFVGGSKYPDASSLVAAILEVWGEEPRGRFTVLTGGEPLLQVDDSLIQGLLDAHFRIAVETNGTIAAPDRIQHLTVSPKAGTKIEQRQAEELKFIFPQEGMTPEDAAALVSAAHLYLQPMDGLDKKANTLAAIEYCKAHPWWRLSVQTHKLIGLP